MAEKKAEPILGVDQRINKAFGMGVLGDASKVVIATDATTGGAAFIDEGDAAGGSVIAGDPLTSDAATASMSTFGHHLWMVEQDLDAGASLETPADAPQVEGTEVTDLDQDY